MSSPPELKATSIGTGVYAALRQPTSARIIGVTSRGLFLLVPPQHIIFVSGERYRSPLTINLDQSFDRFPPIEIGVTVQLSDTRLIFPSIELSISLSTAAVWPCPPPVSARRSRSEQLRTLHAISRGVLTQRDGDGLAVLLPRLVDLSDTSPLPAELSAPLDRLIAVRHAVDSGDNSTLLRGLLDLLGQGRGLTPSGDDVVIGLLLMLNRWHTDRDWTMVNRTVIEAAYRATITISANLIECATSGQGDERLITVVDGIIAGSTSIDACVECVLDWGSSSGIDALVGMILAV